VAFTSRINAGGQHVAAAQVHSSAIALWGYWRHWDKPFEVSVVGDRRISGENRKT
jgi:hypothetical protein